MIVLAKSNPIEVWNDKGFTILELVVSLTLISLIVVFLSGGFKFGRRVWETTQDIQENASIGPIQNYLRSTLSRARPTFYRTAQLKGLVAFSGDRNQIRLVANRPGQLTIGGFHVIEIFAKKDQKSGTNRDFVHLGIRQYLYRQEVFSPSPSSDSRNIRRLIERAKKVQFRFYGATTKGGEKSWRDSWQDQSVLPNLVLITFEFAADDPRKWPELLIELRLAAQ